MTAKKTRGNRNHIPLRAAPTVAAITLILLPTVISVTSSHPLHGNASVAVLTAAMPLREDLEACRHAEFAWRYSATIEVLRIQAEPTAALRAAIWVATAVITALSVAVVDLAQQYRRPARGGSKRWEAGWAGQAGGQQRRVAPRNCAKVQGG